MKQSLLWGEEKVNILRQPGTWLLLLLFIFLALAQYADSLSHPAFLTRLTENIGLTRYTLERILYLLPIIWAGALFGWKGGAIVATAALITMLPRALLISQVPEDAVVETIAVFFVGNLAAFSLDSLRKERLRRAELETAHQELQTNLRVIEESGKRLAALNETSSIISQFLDLSQVIESAVTCVMNVMKVEIVRIYILNEEAQELSLAAYRGVSEGFANNVGNIKVGEGFNGRVAQSGKPLYVEDAFEDPRLTRVAVKDENIRSQLIVPLISKGKVVGTLAVAMRRYRKFDPAETDLLTAIGNQIGVAVGNARLYQQERASEQRYRGLFENAHDAIWLHDEGGNIIAANLACVRLTGYSPEELLKLKAPELLSPDSVAKVREIEERLLRGEPPTALGEVKLVKKDGSEALIQLATSMVGNGHGGVVFQRVARDVTEEKRMQENLKFFLQEITKAQEEERKRISQELHDDTVQALLILSRQIDDLASRADRLPEGELPLCLEELHQDTNAIMQGVKRLSQDLRPATLDRLGLLPALKWLTSKVSEHSGLSTTVKVVGKERRFTHEVELVMFRITQEALRNVEKHAKATRAEVRVEFEEKRTRVTIKDDGKGFEPPRSVADLPRFGKLGLAGMEERAQLLGGTISITSEVGNGTSVVAELPV
ncbi:MAG: PAS domain S-box protein [Dehalococcoidia bacterium]